MRTASAYSGLELVVDIGPVELPVGTMEESASLYLTHLEPAGCTDVVWLHHWMSKSEISLSIGTSDGVHVLRFDDGTLFEYERATRRVYCPTPLGIDARHQLLDHVLPRVLDDLGHLMIHGSAIDTPNGAVIFIGDTGLGKSTLAGSFQNTGVDLLSDDCMRLTTDPDGGVSCVPTYRSLRLWPDSSDAVMPTARFEPMSAVSDKRRLDLPDTPAAGPTSVAAVCVLAAADEAADAVTFSPVAPARAVSLLLAQCFRLDPTDAEATKRTFERCVDVVERVPVVELSYPRQFDRLSDVREAVLERAATGDWAAVTAT